jgi:hypothetical protein
MVSSHNFRSISVIICVINLRSIHLIDLESEPKSFTSWTKCGRPFPWRTNIEHCCTGAVASDRKLHEEVHGCPFFVPKGLAKLLHSPQRESTRYCSQINAVRFLFGCIHLLSCFFTKIVSYFWFGIWQITLVNWPCNHPARLAYQPPVLLSQNNQHQQPAKRTNG